MLDVKLYSQDVSKDGAAVPFRYTCAVGAKVNCYVPTALAATANLMDCRYSQLGAGFVGSLHQLAPTPVSLCRVLFEARLPSSSCLRRAGEIADRHTSNCDTHQAEDVALKSAFD